MNATLKSLRAFLAGYCHFADNAITIPLSFWICGTYLFEAFDSYPYLVITAKVKRAGKTRLSELIGFTSNMPFNVSGASAAALFRKIKDDKPTILWDEAETLASEATSIVRAFLNVGYRKGQSIPRVGENGVTEWPTYCPKAFILIGDVYDTLKDRSIIVEMERGEVPKRFGYETAKTEGLEIADEIRKLLSEKLPEIIEAYNTLDLPYLTDRDEEIWRPLFAMCKVLDQGSYGSLQRIAADLAADKTNPVKYVPNEEAEAKSRLEEYGLMLLRDAYAVTRQIKGNRFGKRFISSTDLLKAVREIPTSPWRKYHNAISDGTEEGLTMNSISYILIPYGVKPMLCRAGKVFRGYSVSEIETSAKKHKAVQ
jgi:hypothetical protein